MAQVTLTPLQAKRTGNGVDVTANLQTLATADTYIFANDGNIILYIDNDQAGGDLTITVVTPNTIDGLAIADLTAVVSQGDVNILGPFPPANYNNASGVLQFSGDVASVKVAAIRV